VTEKKEVAGDDHATIMPQLSEGPATESVRLGSNICGAQVEEWGPAVVSAVAARGDVAPERHIHRPIVDGLKHR
jgi:hypothetical protein